MSEIIESIENIGEGEWSEKSRGGKERVYHFKRTLLCSEGEGNVEGGDLGNKLENWGVYKGEYEDGSILFTKPTKC